MEPVIPQSSYPYRSSHAAVCIPHSSNVQPRIYASTGAAQSPLLRLGWTLHYSVYDPRPWLRSSVSTMTRDLPILISSGMPGVLTFFPLSGSICTYTEVRSDRSCFVRTGAGVYNGPRVMASRTGLAAYEILGRSIRTQKQQRNITGFEPLSTMVHSGQLRRKSSATVPPASAVKSAEMLVRPVRFSALV